MVESAGSAIADPGTRSRFRVIRRLAQGGMAEVLLAERVGPHAFRRHVVLKRILPHLARKPEYAAMLLDEARITASLNHTNIAQVIDVIDVHGSYFLVMEYLHGRNLSEIIGEARRSGGLPIESALAIAIRTAAGLHAAHECTDESGDLLGIIHRDVSPSNVVVTFDGQVKVLDFGIALASSRTTQTESGVLKGKVAYMSPEQCRGAPLDRRADLYSLGVLLYEMLTLEKLRDGLSDFDNMQKIVAGELELPSSKVAGLPAELDALVARSVAVEPDDRYSTGAEIADALEDAAESIGAHPASARELARVMKRLFGDADPAWVETDGAIAMPADVSQEVVAGLAPELSIGDDFEATSVHDRGPLPVPTRPRPLRRWFVALVAVLSLGFGAGLVTLQLTGAEVLGDAAFAPNGTQPDPGTSADRDPEPNPLTVALEPPVDAAPDVDPAPEPKPVDAAPARRVRRPPRTPDKKPPAKNGWDPNSVLLPPDER